MHGRGRRLADGELVEPDTSRPFTFALLVLTGLIVMAVWCPSHDSFEAYLAAAAVHPSGWLKSISGLAERLRIAVSASTNSYVIVRTGRYNDRQFVGACGTWLTLPRGVALSGVALPSMASVCAADSMAPHEVLALLYILGFAAQLTLPARSISRHFYCSLNALRAGRVWTLLSANLAHGHAGHLLHNLLQTLHLGPVVLSALGCEKTLAMLLALSLGASAGSVLWHGVLGNRPGAGSVGGSGIAMGLVAVHRAAWINTAAPGASHVRRACCSRTLPRTALLCRAGERRALPARARPHVRRPARGVAGAAAVPPRRPGERRRATRRH
jgi:hypothetical protein